MAKKEPKLDSFGTSVLKGSTVGGLIGAFSMGIPYTLYSTYNIQPELSSKDEFIKGQTSALGAALIGGLGGAAIGGTVNGLDNIQKRLELQRRIKEQSAYLYNQLSDITQQLVTSKPVPKKKHKAKTASATDYAVNMTAGGALGGVGGMLYNKIRGRNALDMPGLLGGIGIGTGLGAYTATVRTREREIADKYKKSLELCARRDDDGNIMYFDEDGNQVDNDYQGKKYVQPKPGIYIGKPGTFWPGRDVPGFKWMGGHVPFWDNVTAHTQTTWVFPEETEFTVMRNGKPYTLKTHKDPGGAHTMTVELRAWKDDNKKQLGFIPVLNNRITANMLDLNRYFNDVEQRPIPSTFFPNWSIFNGLSGKSPYTNFFPLFDPEREYDNEHNKHTLQYILDWAAKKNGDIGTYSITKDFNTCNTFTNFIVAKLQAARLLPFLRKDLVPRAPTITLAPSLSHPTDYYIYDRD